jgi:hypothetical protein
MIATMATLAGFPALTRASYLALNSGFNRFGDYDAPRRINAMDSKDVLGQMEPNGRDR